MSKRRLTCYGHLTRKQENRPTKKKFEHSNRKKQQLINGKKWGKRIWKWQTFLKISLGDREKFSVFVKAEKFPEETELAEYNPF